MSPIFFRFKSLGYSEPTTPDIGDKIKFLAIEIKGHQGIPFDSYIYNLEIYDDQGTIVPMSDILNAYHGKIDSSDLTTQYPFSTLDLTKLLSQIETDAVHIYDPICDYTYIIIEFSAPIHISKVRFKAKVAKDTRAYNVRFFRVYPFDPNNNIDLTNFTKILSDETIPDDGNFHFVPGPIVTPPENPDPDVPQDPDSTKYKTAKTICIWVGSENIDGNGLVVGAVTFYDEFGHSINSSVVDAYEIKTFTTTDEIASAKKIGDNIDIGMIHNTGGYSVIEKDGLYNYVGFVFNFGQELKFTSVSFKVKTESIIDENWKHDVTIASYDTFMDDFNASNDSIKKSNLNIWQDIPNVMLSSHAYAYFDIRYYARKLISKLKGYFL